MGCEILDQTITCRPDRVELNLIEANNKLKKTFCSKLPMSNKLEREQVKKAIRNKSFTELKLIKGRIQKLASEGRQLERLKKIVSSELSKTHQLLAKSMVNAHDHLTSYYRSNQSDYYAPLHKLCNLHIRSPQEETRGATSCFR